MVEEGHVVKGLKMIFYAYFVVVISHLAQCTRT